MASSATKAWHHNLFEDIRKALEAETHQAENSSKRFVTKQSQELVWKNQNLIAFCGIVGLKFNQDNQEFLNLLEKNYLQTLSILVNIEWKEWEQFEDCFFGWRGADGGRIVVERTDNDLQKYTMEDLVQSTFLGERRIARKFLDERYALMPIEIEEGKVQKWSEGWRLPFINVEEHKVGHGAFGKVTKEVIAVHQFRRTNGSNGRSLYNDKPYPVARKSFHPSDEDVFQKETENLELFRNALSAHSRIASFVAIVTIGGEFNILSELANMDLEHFLYESESPGFVKTLEEMVLEARNLAEALGWLHDGIMVPSNTNKGHLICYHMDLKPANILVYSDKSCPAGVWKISDFGISAFHAPNPHSTDHRASTSALQVPMSFAGVREYLSSTTPGVTQARGSGTWQAPEIHGQGSKVLGDKTDIWSFGCIFVQIVARGLGGVKELKELDQKRAKADGGSNGDCFYRCADGQCKVNPHIDEWANQLPQRALNGQHQSVLYNCQKIISMALKINPKDRPTAKKISLCLSGRDETTSAAVEQRIAPNHSLFVNTTKTKTSNERAAFQTPPRLSTESQIRPSISNEIHNPSIEIQSPEGYSDSAYSAPGSPATSPQSQPNTAFSDFRAAPARTVSMTSTAIVHNPDSLHKLLVKNEETRGDEETVKIKEKPRSKTKTPKRSTTSSVFPTPPLAGKTPMHDSRRSSTIDAAMLSPFLSLSVSEECSRQDEQSVLLGRRSSSDIVAQPSIPPKIDLKPSKQLQSQTSHTNFYFDTDPSSGPQSRLSTPVYPPRASDENSNQGSSIGGDTSLSQHAQSEDPSNVLTFGVPKNVVATAISSRCSKIAFVTHKVVYLFSMDNQRSRCIHNAPEGMQWLGASLSETGLLLRGQKTADHVIVFSIYWVDDCGKGMLTLRPAQELQSFKFVDGVLSDDKTSHGKLCLFQGSESITLTGQQFGNDPIELKVVGKTEKAWFSPAGEWVFAWSIDGRRHHVNAWKVDNIKDCHHFTYVVDASDNFGTPLRDIIAFPQKPSIILHRSHGNVTVVNLMKAPTGGSARERLSHHIEGLQALVVNHDEDAIIYIRKHSNLLSLSPTYKLYMGKLGLRRDSDQSSIGAPPKGSGIKLEHPFQEGSTLYCVPPDENDFETRLKTRVLIAHRNGKVEEIHIL